MKSVIYLSFLLLIFASCNSLSNKREDGWVSLFNGKDLEGWDIKISGYELNNNYKNTFRVENGLLRVCYDEYDKFNGEFGHIFYKTPFHITN